MPGNSIYQNDRKCDMLDARMLAKIARVDPVLSPIQHGSEEHQLQHLARLAREGASNISTVRFSLKSLGMRLPGCSTPYFANLCRKERISGR